MLPLDHLSTAAEKALLDKGLSLDDMKIALRLDLDFDGRYGESWLVYDGKARAVHRLLGDAATIASDLSPEEQKKRKRRQTVSDILNPSAHLRATSVAFIDSLDLAYCTDASVDNFAASNRVVFQNHPDPMPDTEGLEEQEKKEILKKWNEPRTAFVAGYCTNARKQRLFAFLDIVERLQRGDEITEDDQIFDQFNMRCPKCGEI